MNKVGFFRSIQLKFIIIYILLLLVAVQVIGSYLAQALEVNLMDTFKESVNDRIDLLTFNLEQSFDKERPEDGQEPTLEEDIQATISNIDTTAITNLQVIDNQSRVLGAIGYSNQDVIGKKINVDIVQRVLLFGAPIDHTALDRKTKSRTFVKATPIKDKRENVVGVIYTETSLEGIYDQLQNINQVIFQGSILMITVSAILGVFVARAITKPII